MAISPLRSAIHADFESWLGSSVQPRSERPSLAGGPERRTFCRSMRCGGSVLDTRGSHPRFNPNATIPGTCARAPAPWPMAHHAYGERSPGSAGGASGCLAGRDGDRCEVSPIVNSSSARSNLLSRSVSYTVRIGRCADLSLALSHHVTMQRGLRIRPRSTRDQVAEPAKPSDARPELSQTLRGWRRRRTGGPGALRRDWRPTARRGSPANANEKDVREYR